jgi:hypothetical protein
MSDNPEIKKTEGSISISYHVYCPHCGDYLDDYYDKEWFGNTMGEDFPIDDGYNQTFQAVCPKCNGEFLIETFVY